MRMLIKGFEYIFYSNLDQFERLLYQDKIFFFLKKVAREYPGFSKWYYSLFDNNMIKCGREIIICLQGTDIAAVAILKRDNNESKICTLRVGKLYRSLGIGKELMKSSLEWLNTDKPLITLHMSKQREFNGLFEYFGFKLQQKNLGYYKFLNIELAYNGILPEKNIIFNNIEIAHLEQIIEESIEYGLFNIDEIYNKYIFYWWQKQKILQFN